MASKRTRPRVNYQKLCRETQEKLQELRAENDILRADGSKWKEKAIDLVLRLDARMSEVNSLLSMDGLTGPLVKLLTTEQKNTAVSLGCRPEMYAVELLQCYQEGRVGRPRGCDPR